MNEPDASESEFIRAFIAVRIPPGVIAQLVTVQNQLKRAFRDASWTRPEAVHITLHFLGNTKTEQIPELVLRLMSAVHGKTSFKVQLGGVGSFAQRVLWVGIQQGELELKGLAKSIRAATDGFGCKQEVRAYNAHVTLGRFRQRRRGVEKALGEVSTPDFIPWNVPEIELIQSKLSAEGSRYTVLTRIRLRET